jgi:hypothetical protein
LNTLLARVERATEALELEMARSTERVAAVLYSMVIGRAAIIFSDPELVREEVD